MAVKEPPRWSDWEIDLSDRKSDRGSAGQYKDQVIWWWRNWRSRISKHKRISAGLDIQEISEEEGYGPPCLPTQLTPHSPELSCGNHEQLYQATPINLGKRQAFTYSLKRMESFRQIEAITTVMIMAYLKRATASLHTSKHIYKQGKQRKKESSTAKRPLNRHTLFRSLCYIELAVNY